MKPDDSADARLLDEIAALSTGGQRRDFFDRRPELRQASLVPSLCAEVTRLFGVDLEKARRLAETARWLAETLDDDAGRALGDRAAANVLHSLGECEKAQMLYAGALARFLELGEDFEAATTRSSALLNLAILGDYATAYEWHDAARRVFARFPDPRRLAVLEHNHGIILGRQDRWREALESYRVAFEEFDQLGQAQEVAICLRNVAVCHIHLHHFEEALAVYEQNRAYCQQHGLTRVLLQVDYNIAYLYYLRGEYMRAIRLYRAVREDCEAAGDDYHKALCDLDQAEMYLDLNLVEEAAELSSSAHAIFEQLGMPYESAKALTNRAIACSREGSSLEALELLRSAREIFVAEKNRLWPALIDFYQAVILSREHRSREAESLARSAREAFSEAAIAPKAAMCEMLLAELLLDLDRPEEARAPCRAALERLADLELPALEHRGLLTLGRVEEAIGDPEAALAAYRRSHHWLESLRSRLQGEDLKIAFLKDKLAVYENLVWLTLQSPRRGAQEDPSPRRGAKEEQSPRRGAREHQSPRRGAHEGQSPLRGAEEASSTAGDKIPFAPGDLRATFDYIESAKSRGLADLLAFRAHDLKPRTPARSGLAENVRSLREELNWLYRQVDREAMRGGQRALAEVRGLQTNIRGIEDQLLRALRELQETDREYTSLQAGTVVDLEAVRGSLSPQAILVEYFIARGTIFVCVVDRERLEITALGKAARARELYRFLQFQLSRLAPGARHNAPEKLVAEATRARLRQLHDLLIGPIRHLLDKPELILVPHSFLHYVPFHALHDGDGYLIDRFSISYAPSAGVFHLCAAKPATAHDPSLVLGVADERAPHILVEVRAVAGALPGAKLRIGSDASEEAIKEHGAACRFLHIATHGMFRRDNPMFSAIQLGTSRLSLFDLYDLQLSADMVVLSGCGTGLSAVLGADELVGLTRGWLYAGARSVLVSLWDVHDASTAVFMRRFYHHLGRGCQRARALQRTMQDVREEYPHPYHWAAFVLVGKPADNDI